MIRTHKNENRWEKFELTLADGELMTFMGQPSQKARFGVEGFQRLAQPEINQANQRKRDSQSETRLTYDIVDEGMLFKKEVTCPSVWGFLLARDLVMLVIIRNH